MQNPPRAGSFSSQCTPHLYGKPKRKKPTRLESGGLHRPEHSESLAQLIKNGRVLQRGSVLRDGLVLGNGAQEAAHDLS
jgi:hypothetical protein